jgi:hypothetical protein
VGCARRSGGGRFELCSNAHLRRGEAAPRMGHPDANPAGRVRRLEGDGSGTAGVALSIRSSHFNPTVGLATSCPRMETCSCGRRDRRCCRTPGEPQILRLAPLAQDDTIGKCEWVVRDAPAEDGSSFARMPTLGAVKLRRGWGTRMRIRQGVCGLREETPAAEAAPPMGLFAARLKPRP